MALCRILVLKAHQYKQTNDANLLEEADELHCPAKAKVY